MQDAKPDGVAAREVKDAATVALWCRRAWCLPLAFCILHYSVHAQTQLLVDRVLARVGTRTVTLTDVRAVVGLGLVEPGPGADREAVALRRAIDRELLLDEVARFPPPEPSTVALAEEVAAMKARAGTEFDALAASTGLDERRLQELARQTLRIRAYVAQRFGTAAQVTEEEVRKYYDDHPAAFMRDGTLLPFEAAEPAARQQAAAERLAVTIDQWIDDLRMRAEIVVVGAQP